MGQVTQLFLLEIRKRQPRCRGFLSSPFSFFYFRFSIFEFRPRLALSKSNHAKDCGRPAGLPAHAYQCKIGFIALLLHGLLRRCAKCPFVRILRQIAIAANHLFTIHNANQPLGLACVPGNFYLIGTHRYLLLRFRAGAPCAGGVCPDLVGARGSPASSAPSSYTLSPFRMRWPPYPFSLRDYFFAPL